MSIDRYLIKGNTMLVAGAILFFCGFYMGNLVGNVAGLVGFAMICYALLYPGLKQWRRSKRE